MIIITSILGNSICQKLTTYVGPSFEAYGCLKLIFRFVLHSIYQEHTDDRSQVFILDSSNITVDISYLFVNETMIWIEGWHLLSASLILAEFPENV